jgi:hypothetical protein
MIFDYRIRIICDSYDIRVNDFHLCRKMRSWDSPIKQLNICRRSITEDHARLLSVSSRHKRVIFFSLFQLRRADSK